MKEKRVSGPSEIIKDMQRLRERWGSEAAKTLVLFIENPIGKEAVLHCPVKTGNLASSWTVEEPVVTDGNLSVRFGFGVDYGVWVHERTELKHQAPTGPKFLENAVMAHMHEVPDGIAVTMDYVLEVD